MKTLFGFLISLAIFNSHLVYAQESCSKLLTSEQTLFQVLLTRSEFSEGIADVNQRLNERNLSIHVGSVTERVLADRSTEITIEIRHYHYADSQGSILIGHMIFNLPVYFGGIGKFVYVGFQPL